MTRQPPAKQQQQQRRRKVRDCPLAAGQEGLCGSSRGAFGQLRAFGDYELLEMLGQGFFGTVWRVRERRTSGAPAAEEVVMKIPLLSNNSYCWSRSAAKRVVAKEDFMLRRLRHPNVIQSRGLCVQRTHCWQLNLLVELCDSGSLQQLILHRQQPFPWLQRSLVALDVCRAMSYVHAQGFMHRDLTSMNVLLKSDGGAAFPKALVADFGLSCVVPRRPHICQQVGTQNWMSPEMLREEFYDQKNDVFSFGIIVCQMIARIDADHDAGLYRTPMFGLDYLRFTARCPSETPLALLSVAFMCCVRDPDARPSFEDLTIQLQEVIQQNADDWGGARAREKTPNSEDIRVGRSRSDAAIRASGAADATPQRTCGGRASRHPSSRQHQADGSRCTQRAMTIPEGAVPGWSPPPAALSGTDSMKELAASLANGDPNYREAQQNPFYAHERYRSMRKMRPEEMTTGAGGVDHPPGRHSSSPSPGGALARRDEAPAGPGASTRGGVGEEGALEQANAHHTQGRYASDTQQQWRRRRTERLRSLSLPASFVYAAGGADRRFSAKECHSVGRPLASVGSMLKKMSITLGLGEQRDLQGRITMSFRDYDQEFNANARAPPSERSALDIAVLEPHQPKAGDASLASGAAPRGDKRRRSRRLNQAACARADGAAEQPSCCLM